MKRVRSLPASCGLGLLIVVLATGCVFRQQWRFVEVKNSRPDPVVLYIDGDKLSDRILPGAVFRTRNTVLRGGAIRLEARNENGRALEKIDLVDAALDNADDGTTIRTEFGARRGVPPGWP